MKISVITVCRNSQKTIGYTIESFLRQCYPDKEMILVDGLSTDGTLDVVRSFGSDAIHISSEADTGIYDAMNKGLRHYAGDAVGFLNSDDAFHTDMSLELIAQALRSADVAFGDLAMVRDHTSKKVVRFWHCGEFTRRGFHLGWAPPHPTFYVRRKVVDAVGEFDTRYTIAADYDFALRALMKHGFKSHYIPATLVDFQLGGHSTQRLGSTLDCSMQCLRVRQQHFGHWPIDLAFFGRPIRRVGQVLRRTEASR